MQVAPGSQSGMGKSPGRDSLPCLIGSPSLLDCPGTDVGILIHAHHRPTRPSTRESIESPTATRGRHVVPTLGGAHQRVLQHPQARLHDPRHLRCSTTRRSPLSRQTRHHTQQDLETATSNTILGTPGDCIVRGKNTTASTSRGRVLQPWTTSA